MLKPLLFAVASRASLALAALLASGTTTDAIAQNAKPTVVLVHGAFAESASWNAVLAKLIAHGYPVLAVANPLRGQTIDAAYVSCVLDGIKGPIVLVGHSYGGTVISNAVNGRKNVRALVYVAAFAPDSGETPGQLTDKFPGSTLGAALAPPVPLPDGGKDLYVSRDKYPAQFAADVRGADARVMAATQRPAAAAAFDEASGVPAWKSLPSWFIYGTGDLNISPETHAFMARRARAKETVVVKGASHVVMISHPDAVATLIEHAAIGQ